LFTAGLAQCEECGSLCKKGLLDIKPPDRATVATMSRSKVRLDAAALEAFRVLGRIGGKKGGPKGGKARWKGVSVEERRAHARKAARARWAKLKKKG
jgi:hypothetical protein